MNKFRIVLVVAIVAGVGALIFAIQLGIKQNKMRLDIASLTKDLATTRTDLSTTRTDLANTKQTLTKTKDELTATQSDLSATKVALATKTEEAATLKISLDTARPPNLIRQKSIAMPRS